MTILELTQWRDANMLPDTWYLEIDDQGLGSILTLANVRAFARDAWRGGKTRQVRVVHVLMAGDDAAWIPLRPAYGHECPGCGTVCEALIGDFSGKGILAHEWFYILMAIFFAFWIGAENGAVYGWLIFGFFLLVVIGKFFRQKRPIWRCPACHLTRLRQK